MKTDRQDNISVMILRMRQELVRGKKDLELIIKERLSGFSFCLNIDSHRRNFRKCQPVSILSVGTPDGNLTFTIRLHHSLIELLLTSCILPPLYHHLKQIKKWIQKKYGS